METSILLKEYINLYSIFIIVSYGIVVPVVRKRSNITERFWLLMLFTYLVSFVLYIEAEICFIRCTSVGMNLLDILIFLPVVVVFHLYFSAYTHPEKVTRKFILQCTLPYAALLQLSIIVENLCRQVPEVHTAKEFFENILNPGLLLNFIALVYLIVYCLFVAYKSLSYYFHYQRQITAKQPAGADRHHVKLLMTTILLQFTLMVLNALLLVNTDTRVIKILYGVITLIFFALILSIGYNKKEETETETAEDANDGDVGEQVPGHCSAKQYDKNAVLREKLLRYFEEHKPYLNKDLKMDELAQALNTNRSYISQLFSREFNTSFYAFVNRYRIEHSSALMKENGNFSIEYYAEAAGFKSRSVFFKQFKEYHGHTPYAYLRSWLDQTFAEEEAFAEEIAVEGEQEFNGFS